MIRVLADANVLLSAALARSPEASSVQILDAALADRIELVVSPALLAEIESVVSRPRLRRYLSAEQARRFLIELAGAVALERDPRPPHPAVCRDPADDYLVALARSAGSDCLVTGDRDLHVLGLADVVVLTPRELVDRLAREACRSAWLTGYTRLNRGGATEVLLASSSQIQASMADSRKRR